MHQDLEGMDPKTYAWTRSDFIDFGTVYPTWPDIVHNAKRSPLCLYHHFTRHFYFQRLRLARGLEMVDAYDDTFTPLRDALSFAVFPFLATMTAVPERPPAEDSWRSGGTSQERA